MATNDINHIEHFLNDYIDGTLGAVERDAVQAHVQACAECQAQLERMQKLLAELGAISRRVTPQRDLWNGIEKKIDLPLETELPVRSRRSRDRATTHGSIGPNAHATNGLPAQLRRRPVFARVALSVLMGLVLIICVSLIRWGTVYFSPAWDITWLQGTSDAAFAEASTELKVGEWLETNTTSRARLAVGRIGNVELAPNTTLQLRKARLTDHRLALSRGRIHAKIWAPPRLFFVETPAGLAVDLGCEYTLEVDTAGVSHLHVLSGFVSFEREGRQSLVPAGWKVVARPDGLPGTPFAEDASSSLLEALSAFDFEQGGADALQIVLVEARPADALTLWELISRTDGAERARVYDRLTELVPPPSGTTPAGILSGDQDMKRTWQKKLDIDVLGWWGYLKMKSLDLLKSNS